MTPDVQLLITNDNLFKKQNILFFTPANTVNVKSATMIDRYQTQLLCYN